MRLLVYIVGGLVILGVIFSPFDSYAKVKISPFGGVINVGNSDLKIRSVVLAFQDSIVEQLELVKEGDSSYRFVLNRELLLELDESDKCSLNLLIVGEHDIEDQITDSYELVYSDNVEYCNRPGKVAEDIFYKLQKKIVY